MERSSKYENGDNVRMHLIVKPAEEETAIREGYARRLIIDFKEITDGKGRVVEELAYVQVTGNDYFSDKGKSTLYRDLFHMALLVGRDDNPYATAKKWVRQIIRM